MRFHGPNVVSCEVIGSGNRTPLIGAYLPPSTLGHLPNLEEDLIRFWDQDPIVLGYLNADIRQAQNPRSHQVDDLLMEFGLVDILHHFRKRCRFLHMKTWLQVQRGRFMRTRCDYILGTDWRQFEMVVIRDVRN